MNAGNPIIRFRQVTEALRWRTVMACLVLAVCCVSVVDGEPQTAERTDWTWQSDETLRQSMQAWLDDSSLSPERKRDAGEKLERWQNESSSSVARIDRVTDVLSSADPRLAEMQSQLQSQSTTAFPPQLNDFFPAGEVDAIIKRHAQLLLGRWLVQNEYYDEAIDELDGILPAQVWDGAAVLFYRSTARHALLKFEECREDLEQLLQHEENLPRRYAVLARIMLADVENMKRESLDEVSRLMNDVRRRTGLQRAGQIVRRQEQEVVDKLNKLIETLEQQQQQQQQQQQAKSDSSRPMDDSKPAADKGSGEIANKQLPDGGQWGNLPPAERAAALAEMTKSMPPHYRTAIEEYFRKLANENDKDVP